MRTRDVLREVRIRPVNDNPDDIGIVLLNLAVLFWLLFGMVGLKVIEKIQLQINRIFGIVASPQDKDLHMLFFLSTLYIWLHVVDVSHIFLWLRSGLLDGESDLVWPYYRDLIKTFGLERFLRDSDAVLLDESKYGQLYRKTLREGDEPLMLLCVYDATVGPSGKPSRYFLRVPPYMRTAKEAVAWTFGMSWRDYAPSIET
jgi:hypothetical protein